MSAEEVVKRLRESFKNGKTLPVENRVKQLKALKRMYEENKKEMCDVLAKDLRKSTQEAIVLEIDFLLNDITHTLMNIHEWVKPEYPSKGFINLLDSIYICNDPYGVALVIGAWNYPLQLTMMPVAGAIAAGNCVVLKPSELASASEKFLCETIPKYLDSDVVQVYTGGVKETTELLKQRFDYIFFTGSTTTGKIVHSAANKYLTPVTLELGGKSPVYIDNTVNISTTVRRLLWGKMTNAGQTCVAPDYVLCTKEVEAKILEAAKVIIKEFYGEDVKQSPDFCRIINDRHFDRVVRLLSSGKVALGGDYDAKERYIAPTILTGVSENDPVMQDEIFGPVLPIINVEDVKGAIDFINGREKPLAMYIFSNNSKNVDLILENTSAGGITVNDTVMHLGVDTLPFGGVGMSGMGSYHGKFSFDTFTHKKSVLHKNLGAMGEKLGMARYPPYSNSKIQYLKFMLAPSAGIPLIKHFPKLIIFMMGYAANYVIKKYYK
ncbi:unnamed protein product [Brassicogethes aeneus]|uniref:Aldehyde dehydrogenase n=1 Tax=Brassicogethes aeneus TaxID=1431903 RepID=A0A9P0BL76_BRAAE|nr:unnamed protein product [Brassicogethes aeneus]